MRSLITLKALTFMPTGGIVAAPTTSLPEQIGGVRNWDYRFCWVRDASLTLDALLNAGYVEEAASWREWLLRAVAGHPSEVNIAYGLRGERRLTEMELPWLSGYEGSTPVRTGNAAYSQFQLDIYGEVADTLFQCRRVGMPPNRREAPGRGAEPPGVPRNRLGKARRGPLGSARTAPPFHPFQDDGLGGARPGRAIHGKGLARPTTPNGPLLRDRIHAQVCREGFDPRAQLLRAVLRIQAPGRQPPHDAAGGIPARRRSPHAGNRGGDREASHVPGRLRASIHSDPAVDGLPRGEAAFLACTFWLADNYQLQGRREAAVETFERLLSHSQRCRPALRRVRPG